MTLKQTKEKIEPLDMQAMNACRQRWNALAKPLYGLGSLEEILVQAAGIRKTPELNFNKKALVVMCADNGVTVEGVTQTDSSVTAVVTDNFARGETTACIMSEVAGVDVFPVDIGVKSDTFVCTKKVRYGTGNIKCGPAMTEEEAVQAIEIGISTAEELSEKGYQIFLTGEMGIGNTTTSSAVISVLLACPPEEITGRGAGLSDEGLRRKQTVIKQAIAINAPNKKQPLDILAKVGGLDIAGLTGVFLGAAALRIPVVIDGFISAAAALLAMQIEPLSREYMIASHQSKEPGMEAVMRALSMEPLLHCNMKLGEGTGAVALMPLLDMALAVYQKMPTFDGIEIEAYKPFADEEER